MLIYGIDSDRVVHFGAAVRFCLYALSVYEYKMGLESKTKN